MIVVSGMAGALVGPLPWPVASLPGFVQLDAATGDWMPKLVENALADARHSADALAWKSVGLYRAGDGAEACRLAQRWDWCGPSLGIDVECASGLVALLMAADELTMGHCDIAIVVAEQKLPGVTEWDQECAPLAAAAREAAPRAGAAALVLERAVDAQHARARLLGGAHRRLGSPAGMVGMSLRGIAELLGQGLRRAELTPADVGYCELHALGTPIGDAVELSALCRVWREGGNAERPTRLGSQKAAFGHLEAAAGLVGVTRTIGWLESGVLPPTAWRQPMTSLAELPPALTLCDGGLESGGLGGLRAGGCLALSRSGVGAVVFLGPR
jgi:acyl transferase domain-containing protein